MSFVALVGPEIEENLSLRYIASSLAVAGFRSELVPFNFEGDFGDVLRSILQAPEPPIAVGISLAFQWRARDFLALAVALREGGYRGHITVGGHFGTFAAKEILSDFPEIDSVVRQEAEETMVALARALQAGAPLGAIPGLALHEGDAIVFTEHPTLPELATLPAPTGAASPRRASATASRRSSRAAAATRTARFAASPRGTSSRCRANATACATPTTWPTKWWSSNERAASTSSSSTTTTSSSPGTARTASASPPSPTPSRRRASVPSRRS